MRIILIISALSFLLIGTSGCALFKSRGVYNNCDKVQNSEAEFACDKPMIGR